VISVAQRVSRAEVRVEGAVISSIGAGLLILLGVARGDAPDDASRLARKIAELRIFEDDGGKMNRSLLETGGAALVVSQFTLLADCRKGRRPAFTEAALPVEAVPLYELFMRELAARGVPVQAGRFGAMMQVGLVNDGPVTLILNSRT
jgi:D-tyrosyl-tRNA(Tyr) deacylase